MDYRTPPHKCGHTNLHLVKNKMTKKTIDRPDNKIPQRSKPYPERGQTCNSCGKTNHFPGVCRLLLRPERRMYETNTLTRMASTDFILQNDDRHKYLRQASITYGYFGTTKAIIDSGETVNTMGEHIFRLLTQEPSLQASPRQFHLYGSSKLRHILGELLVELSYEGQRCQTVVYVIKEDNHELATLLGQESAIALGLLDTVHSLSTPDPLRE